MDNIDDPDPASFSSHPNLQSPPLPTRPQDTVQPYPNGDPYYRSLLAAMEQAKPRLQMDNGYNEGGITGQLIGEGNLATQHPDYPVNPQMQPNYDPRALLNPRASSSKRSASSAASGGSPADVAHAGQVSLVERLHNVHHRTSSPAKRLKTDDDNAKNFATPSVRGGGALDVALKNGEHPATTAQSTSIDLTMSKLQ